MRFLYIALVALIVGCAAQKAPAPASAPETAGLPEGFTRFIAHGESLGVAGDARYFVIVDDRVTDHDLRRRITKYVSYIFTYRGMTETFAADLSDYYVLVNFSADQNSNSQTLELTAVSTKVYEATKVAKPRWYAASVHYGSPLDTESMLAMHVLAVRDFAGANPNPYQGTSSYRNDSELVSVLKNAVGP